MSPMKLVDQKIYYLEIIHRLLALIISNGTTVISVLVKLRCIRGFKLKSLEESSKPEYNQMQRKCAEICQQ